MPAQGSLDQRSRRGAQRGLAHAVEQHVADVAGLGLLVHRHQLEPALGAQVGRHHGQPGAFDQPCDAVGPAARHQAQVGRQRRGDHHAAAHGFAVQPLAVTEAGLDGVAEGVAEVQDGAAAAFALVTAHHLGLDLARALHGPCQGLGLTGQQGVEMGLEPVQQRRVGDGRVLDDLGQPRTQLTRGQRGQRGQVADHALGLLERADHVLSQRVVDGRLAAHRRVHLRQQRGRQLHERHAAHVAGGGEAGHVAHDAAAEREQHRLAVAALAQQVVEHPVEVLPVLVGLAVGQQQVAGARRQAAQRGQDAFAVQGEHGRVAHQHGMAARRQPPPRARLRQQAAADEDVVVLAGRSHRDDTRRRLGRVHTLSVYGPAWIDQPGHLQLHQRHAQQGRYRGPGGLDHEVRGAAVQRIALAEQLAQPGQRVGHLQQRALGVVAQPARKLVRRGAQVQHVRARVQGIPVGWAQHGATAGGQNLPAARAELVDDVLLDVAEALLAVLREEVSDRHADPRLDLGVAVGEDQAQLAGQVAADGGLAAAGHAHQRNGQRHGQAVVKTAPPSMPSVGPVAWFWRGRISARPSGQSRSWA
jgi:hypothetical protein